MVSHGRIRAITTIIALLFCVAIVRVLQVQVFEYPVHANTVERQQISDITLVAPRGAIFDRNGNVLAVSNRAFVIRINTIVVTDTQAAHDYANAIAPAFSQPVDSLRQRIDSIVTDSRNTPRTLPNIIAYNISPAAIGAFRQARAKSKLDGAWEEEHWTRNYPFGALAGPTVGFVTHVWQQFLRR